MGARTFVAKIEPEERRQTTHLLPLLLALLQPRRKLGHPLPFVVDLPEPQLQPRRHSRRDCGSGKVGRSVEAVVGTGGELLDEGLDRREGNAICMPRNQPNKRTKRKETSIASFSQ